MEEQGNGRERGRRSKGRRRAWKERERESERERDRERREEIEERARKRRSKRRRRAGKRESGERGSNQGEGISPTSGRPACRAAVEKVERGLVRRKVRNRGPLPEGVACPRTGAVMPPSTPSRTLPEPSGYRFPLRRFQTRMPGARCSCLGNALAHGGAHACRGAHEA